MFAKIERRIEKKMWSSTSLDFELIQIIIHVDKNIFNQQLTDYYPMSQN